MPTAFEAAVRQVLLSTRPGEVLTYGEVAAEAGYPGAARAVGNYLRRTNDDVPWHRVVGTGDRIISRCARDQMRLLRDEGLVVDGVRVRRGERSRTAPDYRITPCPSAQCTHQPPRRFS